MKRILFNKALRILLITNGMILVAGAMIGPIYALFVEKVGGDLLDASLTGGVFAFAAGMTTLVAGRYADRTKDNKKIVSLGYLLMGLGFLSYTFVDSIWSLFLVQSLIGFSEALYSPAFDALYSRHVTERKAGREWGAWESMDYFSVAAGTSLGGLIVTAFGFNAIFVLMAALSLVSATYVHFIPKRVL